MSKGESFGVSTGEVFYKTVVVMSQGESFGVSTGQDSGRHV